MTPDWPALPPARIRRGCDRLVVPGSAGIRRPANLASDRGIGMHQGTMGNPPCQQARVSSCSPPVCSFWPAVTPNRTRVRREHLCPARSSPRRRQPGAEARPNPGRCLRPGKPFRRRRPRRPLTTQPPRPRPPRRRTSRRGTLKPLSRPLRPRRRPARKRMELRPRSRSSLIPRRAALDPLRNAAPRSSRRCSASRIREPTARSRHKRSSSGTASVPVSVPTFLSEGRGSGPPPLVG